MSQTAQKLPNLTRAELTTLLLIVSLSAFATPLVISGVSVALLYISEDFNTLASHIGWVLTSFLMASAVFLFPFGKLSDRIGKQSIFMAGLSFQLIGFVIAGLSTSFPMLLVGMALGGLGSAQVLAVGIPLLTTNFPHQERGKVIGINTAATYTALALGPFVGGVLIDTYGWHSIFWALIPIVALALCLAIRVIPKLPKIVPNTDKPFDGLGAVIYIIAASLVLVGISRIMEGSDAVIMLIIGIAIAVIFFWWELKQPEPVFPIHVFIENKLFRNSSLAALINYGASYAVAMLLSFYLLGVRGFTGTEAGTVLIAQSVVMAVLTPFTGRLSDRIDPKILATVGMIMTALALFAFSTLTSTTPLWVVIGILIFLGAGIAFFSSPNMNSIMSSVPDTQAGIASATAGTMRVFGQVVSVAAATIAFAVMLGSVVISPEIADSLLEAISTIFIALGLLCTIGIWFSYSRGKSGNS
ncbi:MAG: MFS transporter [Methanomicrobiales archaeon]|nr:MFS transporter [Methanomicrobiales archaeon]